MADPVYALNLGLCLVAIRHSGPRYRRAHGRFELNFIRKFYDRLGGLTVAFGCPSHRTSRENDKYLPSSFCFPHCFEISRQLAVCMVPIF